LFIAKILLIIAGYCLIAALLFKRYHRVKFERLAQIYRNRWRLLSFSAKAQLLTNPRIDPCPFNREQLKLEKDCDDAFEALLSTFLLLYKNESHYNVHMIASLLNDLFEPVEAQCSQLSSTVTAKNFF
jgi:hypothetical protein